MIVTIDVTNESIARLLFGIAQCPEKYQKRMIGRAIKYLTTHHYFTSEQSIEYLRNLYLKYNVKDSEVVIKLLTEYQI